MGQKANLLMEEILVTTAFLGGVWSALQFNPESQFIHTIGDIGAILGQSGTAANIVAAGELLLAASLVFAVLGSYVIGRKFGLAAFATMWVAGYLFVHGSVLGVILLFVGWGLGVAGIAAHTDEGVGAGIGGAPPRY